MCGNGVRCVAKYIHDHGIARKDRVTIETGRGVLTLDLEVEGRQGPTGCRVDMGAADPRGRRDPDHACPATRRSNVPLTRRGPSACRHGRLDGQPARGRLRRRRRRSSRSRRSGRRSSTTPRSPRRVNVHFVEVIAPGEVRMRTWERGSGITLACGTGACAVCVAGRADRPDRPQDPGPPARRRPRAGMARRRRHPSS